MSPRGVRRLLVRGEEEEGGEQAVEMLIHLAHAGQLTSLSLTSLTPFSQDPSLLRSKMHTMEYIEVGIVT